MRVNPQAKYGPLVLFAGSGALLLGALAFQYLGGLEPCPLCLWQRVPHDAVLVFAGLAFFLPSARATVVLMALAAAALAAGVALAAFHSGVEFGWWEGLASCQGQSDFSGDLSLEQLRQMAEEEPPVPCDQVPWSLFGISLAGYNFIFTLALFGYAVSWLAGARRKA
jgi:disulfide bond formation protein DsbB